MHKPIALPLLAGLLMCAGCFTAAPPITVTQAPAPAPKLADIPKALPPVQPDGVSAQNYRSTPQALAEEIDRAEQQQILVTRSRRE